MPQGFVYATNIFYAGPIVNGLVKGTVAPRLEICPTFS